MRVALGNTAPIEVIDGERRPITLPEGAGEVTTGVEFPESVGLSEAFTSLTSVPRGVWHAHSDAAPAWVASDRGALADLLADHYGCQVRPLTTEN